MDGVAAGWHPDPEGRHQLRYWDGNDWTEHVSDNGVTAADPLTPVVPQGVGVPPSDPTITIHSPSAPPAWDTGAPSSTPPPAWGGTDFGNAAVSTPAPAKKKPWGLIILGLLVAAGVAAALIVLVGGGDDDGGGSAFGTHQLSISEDGPQVALRLDLDAGDALRFQALPQDNFDLVAQVVASEDTVLEFARSDAFAEFLSAEFSDGDIDDDELLSDFSDAADLYSDQDGLDALGVDGTLLEIDRYDSNFEEEGEAGVFATPISGTFYLVFGSYNEGEYGDLEVIVEKWGEQVDFENDDLSDLDELFSDDPFFTDEDFFSDDLTN